MRFRFLEAEDMYRRALVFKPTSAALHYNVGFGLFYVVKEWLELTMNLFVFQLGVVLLETNRSAEAYASFNRAIQIDPDHEVLLSGVPN